MFDITILPLFLSAGREQSELPGLFVVGAPRKAVRLRAQDQLMLFLSLVNIAPSKEPVFSPAQQQEMLSRLAETFFTTSGSVTAGMRAVVTRLNDFLLSRNLRAPGEGQVTGSLNLAVLHSSTLLLAHTGATQSLLLGKAQVQQFDDRAGGRGLGLSKQIVPRFYQTTLEPGDLLLICTAPPASWTPRALAGSTQLSLDHLRRRLLGQVGGDMNAAVLKFQTGKGQIIRYRVSAERSPLADGAVGITTKPVVARPLETAPQAEPASSLLQNESPAPTAQADPIEPPEIQNLDSDPINAEIQDQVELPEWLVPVENAAALEDGPAQPLEMEETDQPVEPPVEILPLEPAPDDHNPGADLPAAEETQPVAPTVEPEPARAQAPARPGAEMARRGARASQSTTASAAPRRPMHTATTPQVKARPRQAAGGGAFTQQIGLALKSIFRSGAAARSKVARTVAPLANRVLPQRDEPWINPSPAAMLFIAIVIPLVVVAVATTVYFNAGRAGQFETYLSNASQHVERASQQTDPSLQRESWTQALLWLEQADEYDQNETSLSLRQQAQNGLDGMEGIVRLPYQQAVTEGFAVDVNITRMAATLNDVYLLDSSVGRVLRLYRMGTGYRVDSTFVCGPGQAGSQIIGPLVDLAVLPPNNTYRATIAASDAAGNLIYCAPNQTGYDSLLIPPPDTNWGNIKAINIADGYIYILDPLVNAVWYIFGNNGIFDQKPRLFFSNQVPKMDDVVDMAVDTGFLYLLHSNGRMTTCEASGFELSPTRCNDPAPYGDARTARDPAPLYFPDARFVQMQTTQPPDPSLFVLDDAHASIYHFSLRRLNLQRQYRAEYDPDFPLPDEAPSAFVITPNRRALLAFGNQVYYAPLP